MKFYKVNTFVKTLQKQLFSKFKIEIFKGKSRLTSYMYGQDILYLLSGGLTFLL
jgi:hypothetical protein